MALLVRSRRWSIPLLLLLFIGAGVWRLLTPGIDPRLVGDWTNVVPEEFAATRAFHADGMAAHTSEPGGPESRGRWYVSGDRLHITAGSSPLPAASLRQEALRLWYSLRGLGPVEATAEFKILEITPTTLKIQELAPRTGAGLVIESYRRARGAE